MLFGYILASSGFQAIEFVGMPEARILLAQLVTYMALAPKSNSSYKAIEGALNDIKEQKIEEVPTHLRDSSYVGSKRLGHGVGYKYAHNYPGHIVDQEYIPKNTSYYVPSDHGFEKELQRRLEDLRARKQS